LPDGVFGSSATNSTIRGYLYGAVRSRTWAWSSAASSGPGAWPWRSTTTARTKPAATKSAAATKRTTTTKAAPQDDAEGAETPSTGPAKPAARKTAAKAPAKSKATPARAKKKDDDEDDAEVEIEALVDDGDHYRAHVTSAAFAGKTRVQQHKMVYEALGGRMGGELHALQLVTSVPN